MQCNTYKCILSYFEMLLKFLNRVFKCSNLNALKNECFIFLWRTKKINISNFFLLGTLSIMIIIEISKFIISFNERKTLFI